VASLLLTTEAMVAESPKDDKPMGGGGVAAWAAWVAWATWTCNSRLLLHWHQAKARLVRAFVIRERVDRLPSGDWRRATGPSGGQIREWPSVAQML
jgi:hypothetical protein